MRYVEDEEALRKSCRPVDRHQAGLVLANRLLEILKEEPNAVGLAANQVGVDARVCVIAVGRPVILINPEIIQKSGRSFFQESCLSFPGDYVMTERWTDIVVRASNHKEDLVFSFDKDALECVCVQHEIDHLDGITMHDRTIDMELIKNGKD